MSFFRGDRPFSQFLRHDPFTPFFPRSSFLSPLPISRVFDPYYSPFSPFITTVYDEPRARYEDYTSSSNKTVEASPSQSSDSMSKSSPSQSKEMSRTDRSDEVATEKRHSEGRRHHHRNGGRSPQQQMSLWSPFTGSPFPSSLLNSAFTSLTPLTHAVRALPEITLDMFSTPQAYSVHASVPGMDKKDIKVTVEDGVLTIQAERKESRGRGPSHKSSLTSSTQGTTTQGSPSTTTTGTSSTSQQFTAEMKYPSEEKEDKAAPSTTTESSSAAPTSTGMKEDTNATPSSNVSAPESSNAMEMEEEGDEVDFHHVESFYGRVERSVQLPEDAKIDDLTARYEDGILKIEIPRIQEQKTRGRRIEIQ